jgi:predicted permease
MTVPPRIRSWFRSILQRSRAEREMDAELRFHIEAYAEDLVRSGIPRDEALRRTRIEFGGLERAKEECRDATGANLFDSLLQDIRFGLRMLRKNPGFTAAAVITLALGIGANTVIFSVVNALLLRPLPVERPNELVFLENERYGPSQSYPDYKELRDRNRTFAGLLCYRISPMDLETNAGADRIWGYLATGNYFDVLGVKPVLGQFFHQSDDQHPGASPYAVLSYGTWQSRFGSDPAIVGKTIRINRLPYRVLGVAPHDFHGTEFFYWPEVWVPMMMQSQVEGGNPWLDNPNTWNAFVIGRLKPNVSPGQAEADLNAIAAELAHQYPAENDGLRFRLAKPGLVGNLIGSPARTFSLGILALAVLVLLAACTNLASMLAARATDRQRELAIRLAIGAGRGRVVRQVLIETLMLSLIGGGSGYALAMLLSQSLSRWRAPMDFPVQFNVNPDWRVFFFALIASIVASVLFGSAPAWRASRTDPNAVLKGNSTRWENGRLTFRDILVVVQVALCFVLVAACLLSLRGLQQALKLNLGFEPQHVSVVGFDVGLPGYSEERGRAFQRRALEAIQQLPGVQAASYSNSVPLSIDQSQDGVFPADKPDLKASDNVDATRYQVSPGFFATLGTKLLAGRDFNWHDDTTSPSVAIVNLAFRKQLLHAENPIGKRFRYGLNGRLVEVIGVVEDGKYGSLTESHVPMVFWPILQSYNGTTTLEVKSALSATQMVGEIRGAISRLDPELPLYGAGSLEQMLGFAFFPSRAAAIALSAFGILAIILAVTGIHGLIAYAVSTRTHEIGIRMALGARPVQVLRLVLGKTATLFVFGSLVGLVLTLAVGQMLASVVYEAQPRDPLVMASVVIAIALLGLFASWSPARRATRVAPMVALHHE